MINDSKDEGARMFDIFAFNRTLKATWITKYLENSNKEKQRISLIIHFANWVIKIHS